MHIKLNLYLVILHLRYFKIAGIFLPYVINYKIVLEMTVVIFELKRRQSHQKAKNVCAMSQSE